MGEVTTAPDVSALEITRDAWTEPFWRAAERSELLLPRCAECGTFRWPPGPFCPCCRSQQTEWVLPGPARIYSFTLVRRALGDNASEVIAPALVEFPQAQGIRLTAAVVGAQVDDLGIGATLTLDWSQAANGTVPIFRLEH